MIGRLQPEPPTALRHHPDRAGLPADLFSPARSALTVRGPLSPVVRTARGRTGFLGLPAPDGTLLEMNQSASTPPVRSGSIRALICSAVDVTDVTDVPSGGWAR